MREEGREKKEGLRRKAYRQTKRKLRKGADAKKGYMTGDIAHRDRDTGTD